MKKTALFEKHNDLNAKMVDFAGWLMPVQYQNLKEEVLAVRHHVGVFDVSHMGEFFVTGKDSIKFIDHMLTNDIAGAEIGKAIYSPMCRDDGTVIDDLIVYKISTERILVCVNAANIEKDFNWLSSHVSNFNAELVNKSSEYSLLAVQGPKAYEVLKSIDITNNLQDIEYYSVQEIQKESTSIIYARTGYTGEDGFEIFGSHDFINTLWIKLLEQGVKPCGLGARDVLRLEVCYPLYGHEIDDTVTPLDAALKWTVKLDKPSFIGKEALLNHKPQFRLIKLIAHKGIPREGYKVFNDKEEQIGIVTSGSMSVILGKGVALARVKKELFSDDSILFIEIRNKKYPVEFTKKAFVNGGHK